MKFGEAMDKLEEGMPMCRVGWNGKNMFIFKQIPSLIPLEFVAKMQSLPDAVKAIFEKRYMPSISYHNQFAIVYPDNSIYGWLASPSDICADDWEVYSE